MFGENLIRDLRYGARVLWRNPPLLFGALAILGLGLGACGVIASVTQVVWLRPLPFPEPGEMVLVYSHNTERGRLSSMSPADIRDLEASDALASLGAFRRAEPIVDGEVPQKLRAARVSEEFFLTFGMPTELGRSLSAGEDFAGGNRVAVISHRFWKNHFGAREDVLDQALGLGGEPFTVIGVMPPAFDFPPQTDVWIPLELSAEEWDRRENRYISAIGRLHGGASLEQGQREVSSLATTLAADYPENQGFDIVLRSLHDAVTARLAPMVKILLAAGGLLLLVACGNLMTLYSVQAASRLQEIGVRTALGASRARIASQVLVECLLLTLLGGGVGLLIAWVGNRILVQRTPMLSVRWRDIGIDGEVAAAMVVLSLVCGLLASLAPISRLWRGHRGLGLSAARNDRMAEGWRRNRLANVLTVLQVVLSFVLLVNAGLLLRSFQNLLEIDPGFDPQGVLTLSLELPETFYPEDHQRLAFYREAIEQFEALPEVEVAGAISSLPLAGSNNLMRYAVPGRPVEDGDYAPFVAVTPGTLSALRIPMAAGRPFQEEDSSASMPALVLNRSLVQRLFPDDDPVGRELLMGGADGIPHRIIGVIDDLRSSSLEEPGSAALYGLYQQSPYDSATFCVRTPSDPDALAARVRAVIQEIDPRLATDTPISMDAVVRESSASRRLLLAIIVLFAFVSLAMASVGLYGVLSYRLSRSLPEVSLRMALGAESKDLRRLVLGHAGRILVPGVAVGIFAAFASSRWLASQLFGVERTDPAAYLGAALVLLATAALAFWGPLRRVVRVNPSQYLEG